MRCYGFCDDKGDPVFEAGTTSVTFTGAHFRMSNVKWPEETWLKTESFMVDGKLVVHKEGDPLPENLARSLRAIRRDAPEFWALLEKMKFRFYQQPAGFCHIYIYIYIHIHLYLYTYLIHTHIHIHTHTLVHNIQQALMMASPAAGRLSSRHLRLPAASGWLTALEEA